MPWLRSGDNAATYPRLLALAATPGADDRLLNEVAGWLWRCAMQSAGHMTDGMVDQGTAFLLGGARTPVLADAAVQAGLLCAVPGGWQIIPDPEFLHIRSKNAVEWERQRDRDRKNPELTTRVRFRDGDACRYCGQVVDFKARKGGRSGTYDHTDPGQPATVHTYVVCCRTCNSRMGDGERLPLLDPPAQPYYTQATIAWLDDHGLTPKPGGYRSEPARPTDELTAGGHRCDSARPVTVSDPDPAAAMRDPDPAPNPWDQVMVDDPADPPEARGGAGSGRDGTGLDGSGRAGPGRGGSGRAGPGRGGSGRAGPGRGGSGAAKRRRGRRGRRPGRGGGGR